MANNQITPFQLTDQFTMDNFNQRINETNIALQKKADALSVYTKEESISASTRTALSLAATATPDDALAKIVQMLPDTVESTDYPGCYYRMVDGVTEWLNPPMVFGVEYRTTERYQGKPVYTKAVDCGAGPNASLKWVSYTSDTSAQPINVFGIVSDGTNLSTCDSNRYGGNTSGGNVFSVIAELQNIGICTSSDRTNRNVYAVIEYIKTTD